MAKAQKKAVSDKKTNQEKLEKKLSTAVISLKPLLGEKKFNKRIKKAGKLLAKGVKKEKGDKKPQAEA